MSTEEDLLLIFTGFLVLHPNEYVWFTWYQALLSILPPKKIFFFGVQYVWNLNMKKIIIYGHLQIENKIISNTQDHEKWHLSANIWVLHIISQTNAHNRAVTKWRLWRKYFVVSIVGCLFLLPSPPFSFVFLPFCSSFIVVIWRLLYPAKSSQISRMQSEFFMCWFHATLTMADLIIL